VTEKDLMIRQLEQAFDKRSWHGPNLMGSIRGLTEEQARWRPGQGRHNIWELVVHAAYWKYTVLRKFTNEARGQFSLKGSNWFVRPLPDGPDVRFSDDVARLKDYHSRLLAAVSKCAANALDEIAPGKKDTYRDIIIGVAAHDLYHAGQIQLLKRLQQSISE
jgi:uncharacterized damage-inducible protein DinB